MQVKKQLLKPDMEQETGSRQGKEYIRLYIAILFNFCAEYVMQNAGQNEAQVGIKIARRNINKLR